MAKAKSKSQLYSVRESARAKHVSIKVSHLGEVEIVVPKGFDKRRIPEILKKRQDWIAKTTQRIAAERQSLSPGTAEISPEKLLPQQLRLRSLLEEWRIEYQQTEGFQTSASVTGIHCLTLRMVHQPDACYRVLKHWLGRKAEAHLIPWLRQVSQELELSCNNISVRGQKTIWASCSGKKNISLNYKLLFLPPHLVRYVFIHELCHTVYLNHSSSFWELVEEKEPDYKLWDTELNKAWIYVPEWVERSSE